MSDGEFIQSRSFEIEERGEQRAKSIGAIYAEQHNPAFVLAYCVFQNTRARRLRVETDTREPGRLWAKCDPPLPHVERIAATNAARFLMPIIYAWDIE